MIERNGAWALALGLLLMLSGCAQPSQAQVFPTATPIVVPPTPIIGPPTHTVVPDATPTLTLTPTVTPTPTSTATVTPPATATASPTITPTPACTWGGIIVRDRFDSETLGYPMQMQVYLPPCYGLRPDRRYPVLYLLHGLGYTHEVWNELGTIETANRLIGSGEAAPFIIVMPHEQRDNRFDRAFVDELLPYIDGKFRTLPNRDNRALGGISRGGAWTTRIGFRHPQLFSALGFHSMSIFDVDEEQVSGWLNAIPADLWPRISIDIGELDGLIVSAGWLDRALTRRNIAHNYAVYPQGVHAKSYWAEHMEGYLRFYTAEWGE